MFTGKRNTGSAISLHRHLHTRFSEGYSGKSGKLLTGTRRQLSRFRKSVQKAEAAHRRLTKDIHGRGCVRPDRGIVRHDGSSCVLARKIAEPFFDAEFIYFYLFKSVWWSPWFLISTSSAWPWMRAMEKLAFNA